MAVQSPALWSPATPQEVDQVHAQLQKLLASRAFRNSQRYPALLRYVVEQTLAGFADQLKERTVGIAVFHRAPDYDSSADPVVRVTAGEVRRRLAQYYQEHPDELRIDLPLGSYVPHFHSPVHLLEDLDLKFVMATSLSDTVPEDLVELMASEAMEPPRRRKMWTSVAISSLLLCLLLAAGALLLRHFRRADAIGRFWRPMMSSPQTPAMILGGRMASYFTRNETSLGEEIPLSESTPLSESAVPLNLQRPTTSGEHANTIAVGDAISFARVASLLSKRGSSYAAASAAQTSLEDLRARPTILFGAYNNAWTLHATDRLRYRLKFDKPPGYSRFIWIEDTQGGSQTRWGVDCTLPLAQVTHDYAIIARYFDQNTEQEVVIAAGLRENGTTAASEFLTSNRYLSQLDQFASKSDWAKRNLEAIIETEVVGGRSGPPRVVAATFW